MHVPPGAHGRPDQLAARDLRSRSDVGTQRGHLLPEAGRPGHPGRPKDVHERGRGFHRRVPIEEGDGMPGVERPPIGDCAERIVPRDEEHDLLLGAERPGDLAAAAYQVAVCQALPGRGVDERDCAGRS